MNTSQSHLSNWQVQGPVWAIPIFFVYTGLLVWAFSQSHSLNLTYYLKSCRLLAFCFLFVSMVYQTEMSISSISPIGLFQVIICNTERLKGGPCNHELLGGTSDPSLYHPKSSNFALFHRGKTTLCHKEKAKLWKRPGATSTNW